MRRFTLYVAAYAMLLLALLVAWREIVRSAPAVQSAAWRHRGNGHVARGE